nr:cell division protein SepF [Corynebacterium lactis]
MADFFRGVSNFFGLTPTDAEAAYEDDRYDDFDRRDDHRYEDSYRSERRDERRHRYESRDEEQRGREDRYSRLEPVAEAAQAREPEHVFIKPESGFQDKYSKAPEIGDHFRDGDIVTFDLSDLDPAEQKRYVDFVAGLVFGLRGRIKADGSVFTLFPQGCDVSEVQYDRMSG